MKTKKEFLGIAASNPELSKVTLKQGGVNWDKLVERPNDYYAADSGAVGGMIYYNDTVKFAKKHHLLILQAIAEFENELGEPLKKPNPTNEQAYFNWLAWFAWENTMSDLINYLEE